MNDEMTENKKINVVEMEDMIIDCILTFCENIAELGCPKNEEVDMWFRYLSYEDQRKVADKMLDIFERNRKIYEEN